MHHGFLERGTVEFPPLDPGKRSQRRRCGWKIRRVVEPLLHRAAAAGLQPVGRTHRVAERCETRQPEQATSGTMRFLDHDAPSTVDQSSRSVAPCTDMAITVASVVAETRSIVRGEIDTGRPNEGRLVRTRGAMP